MHDAYRFSRTEFLQALEAAGFPSLLKLAFHLQLSPSQLYAYADGMLPTEPRRREIAAALRVPPEKLWAPCCCARNVHT